MRDKHGSTRSFWHLFIVKDNLTWMAGEMAHLFFKNRFHLFSHSNLPVLSDALKIYQDVVLTLKHFLTQPGRDKICISQKANIWC